jgi:hypothetical protein
MAETNALKLLNKTGKKVVELKGFQVDENVCNQNFAWAAECDCGDCPGSTDCDCDDCRDC